MSANLELFLQGGLGNQLIQHAYAFGLARRTSRNLILNPILLSSIWARLRGITFRSRFVSADWDHFEVEALPMQLMKFIMFSFSKRRSPCVSDQLSHSLVQQLLRDGHKLPWIPMHGYFQRSEAFGLDVSPFWRSLAFKLSSRSDWSISDPKSVVVHVRLGDYLLPQNVRLYARLDLEKQLLTAIQWRDRLGGVEPVHIMTDDYLVFKQLCPSSLMSHLYLLGPQDAEQDFLRLCQYRNIIASNSTFSLCAGAISSVLAGGLRTTMLPFSWFRDPLQNSLQYVEWSQLPFVECFW